MSATTDELQALERKIAYSAARSDIESYCAPRRWSGKHIGTWYDTEATDDGVAGEFVRDAVRYLELRGLLRRHPEQPHLVRIAPDPEQ